MFALFSCSAWVVVSWGVLIILSLALWGQETRTFQSENLIETVLGITFILGSALAFLIMIFGMAIYCACKDRSSAGAKILWFIFFFFTAPFGSTVYFFAVYRKMVAAHREVANG